MKDVNTVQRPNNHAIDIICAIGNKGLQQKISLNDVP